jgi:hypothetical protein
MASDTMTSCPVHLVGSMELESTEAVLRTVSSLLGERVPRLPDGEVGPKKGWIMSQSQAFERNPVFEKVEWAYRDWRNPERRRFHFRLRPGAPVPNPADFAPLGYADWAKDAYALFARLKAEGTIARAARLMIAVPAPYDILNFAVPAADRPKIDPVYEEALLREVDGIAAALPHDQIALQWDCAHAFEFIATNDSKAFYPITRAQLVALLVRLGRRVPPSIQLGYHCCYGNAFLKHFVEPTDTGEMVAVMNGVLAGLGRPVQFMHMPVPHDRSDDAYFAPLQRLDLPAETQFFLGLVHDTDGVEGALTRARAARKFVRAFGIGTECGLAMRSPENVTALLRLQGEIAARIDRGL